MKSPPPGAFKDPLQVTTKRPALWSATYVDLDTGVPAGKIGVEDDIDRDQPRSGRVAV
jgi:hypothetical protein